MKQAVESHRGVLRVVAVAAFSLALYSGLALGESIKVTLSGDQEVPAVKTSASGSGTITFNSDKTVSGSVKTTGVKATMAHIHEAPAGKNGPIIIPLTKSGDNTWSVPAGAKLTDDQYKAFKNGGLYVNVHSDAHKAGEIRAQIKP
ncbi:MAG: CHRD domain-containing protein [Burkholderiales bacterium]